MEPRRNFQFDPFSQEPTGLMGQNGLPDLPDLPSDIDWSNPQSFLEKLSGGGPMPRMASPAEVRKEAKEHSRSIFASFDRLNKIIQRHEATIQKRWVKKTRPQRLKILLEAWPNMPASHRPDFEAFRKESNAQRGSSTQFKDNFMWPYINQEDLSQTKLMPLFLNARGRHPPPAFAAADNDAMHLGIVTKAIVPVFLNEHTMFLHGGTDPDTYGRLVPWDSDPDAFDLMHSRKQFLPGEGLIILEAQARVLKFLVDCCHIILHDIPQDTLVSNAFAPDPEPILKSDSETLGFASLAVMAAEAPYRLPARLSFERLESLLGAKRSAGEDHIWALREDPAYFAECVLITQDHRQETMKDTEGQPHPVTHRVRENKLWARVIGSIIAESYLSLSCFSELHEQSKRLSTLQKRYEAEISPSKDLPKDYLKALLLFRYYLEQIAKGPMNQLKTVVVASPPMRKFFVRDPAIDVNSTKLMIRVRGGVKMNRTEENLIWLLQTLWEDSTNLFLARLPAVVDELERLLQSDAHANSLISGHVVRILGDLSILAQCTRQLEIYQPWAQGFEFAMVDYVEDFKKQYAQWSTPMAQIMTACRETSIMSVALLGIPSAGRFTYPYGKRRTKETVDALQKAESNLDAFWVKADQIMLDKAPDIRRTPLSRLFSEPRMLRRTAEWVEPTATKKRAETVPDQPLSHVWLGNQDTGSQGSSISKTQPKTKIKTKGTSSTSPAPASTPENVPESSDPQPTFPVDSRALKVFRTMFFNPDVTSTPGSVPWKDFLHAMVSIGFRAEKLYGSVWQFSPTKLDVERSIHFHEPHPEGKIAFEVARWQGRRLNRAYGWFGGMFVLKKD